jgi:hypothetical protein
VVGAAAAGADVAGAGGVAGVLTAGGVAGGDCAQAAAFSVSAAAGISAAVARRDRRERVIRRVSSDILRAASGNMRDTASW